MNILGEMSFSMRSCGFIFTLVNISISFGFFPQRTYISTFMIIHLIKPRPQAISLRGVLDTLVLKASFDFNVQALDISSLISSFVYHRV